MEDYKNLEDVFKLYEKHGDKGYIGEPITQLEHAMQATLLAVEYFKKAACNIHSEVILAAFLKYSTAKRAACIACSNCVIGSPIYPLSPCFSYSLNTSSKFL